MTDTQAAETTADRFGLNQPPAPRAAGLASLARGKAPKAPGNALALPEQVEPDKVTGTPEERLKTFEGAIDAAAGAVDRVKGRAALVIGTSLREIRDQGLHSLLGYDTFEDYAEDRWGYSRPYAYQLMDTPLVVTALSAIADIKQPLPDFPESWIRVLAPVYRNHGPEDLGALWQLATGTGRRITAKLLTEVRDQLALGPKRAELTEDETETAGSGADGQGIQPGGQQGAGAGLIIDAEVVDDPLLDWKVALKGLQNAYKVLAPSAHLAARQADPEAVEALLADIQKMAAGVARRAKQASEAS
ncbi:hypothetical protein ACFVXH_39595 [Kitasatospora sp. NPDC058184]|uniref:hypothetical protein n=1 Tax=Kitasatospora sp. NPDC058184 TaxID=3346370 RepID=UPI0036DDE425